jgi:hypothetical protein
MVRQSLVPLVRPLGVDDLEVEEALADELEHSRLTHSFFSMAPWLLALVE